MDWTGCEIVEVVPGKVSGAPIIRGTRVPAEFVLDNHESGESVADIAENFGLRLEDVRKLLAFASAHKPAESRP